MKNLSLSEKILLDLKAKRDVKANAFRDLNTGEAYPGARTLSPQASGTAIAVFSPFMAKEMADYLRERDRLLIKKKFFVKTDILRLTPQRLTFAKAIGELDKQIAVERKSIEQYDSSIDKIDKDLENEFSQNVPNGEPEFRAMYDRRKAEEVRRDSSLKEFSERKEREFTKEQEKLKNLLSALSTSMFSRHYQRICYYYERACLYQKGLPSSCVDPATLRKHFEAVPLGVFQNP